MSDAAPLLSAVVPVRDEIESLPGLHEELRTALEALGRARGATTEIVYVDDGSTDGSTGLLERLVAGGGAEAGAGGDGEDDPAGGHVRVRAVLLRRGFGKSGALAAGFAAARGSLVATLDADGQDVPAELPALLDALDGDGARDGDGDGLLGLDLVCGWRRDRNDRAAKRVTSRWYNAATRTLTDLPLHDFNTGLKLMRAEVAEELPLYGEFHRFLPVLAADLGFRVGEVPVRHRPRVAGRTKYRSALRFPKTLLDLLTVLFLTRFADRPLYLFGGVGAALSVAGLVVLAYLSVLKVAFGEGIGQRPLLLFGVLAVLAGLQLVGVGFLGDVLRHATARDRVPYRVRRVVEPPPGIGATGRRTADARATPGGAGARDPGAVARSAR